MPIRSSSSPSRHPRSATCTANWQPWAAGSGSCSRKPRRLATSPRSKSATALRRARRQSASKQADGFLWISDDGKASQRSICLYTLPLGTDLTAGRDSVMALHLPGEREGMHVGTAQVLPAETVHTPTGDRRVLHAMTDSTRHRLVVAEALLFAPGMAKRNEMRRLEAILHTLQPVRQ